MALTLDASDLPVADRADAVREAIAATIVHVDIEFPDRPVAARGAIGDLGRLTVCSIRSTAVRVSRTERFARDDLEPSLFVGLQLQGSSLVVQGERQTVLRPRDLVFYESTVPYTLVDPAGVRQHFFRIPLTELAVPPDTVRRLTATKLAPGSPVTELAVDWFQSLGDRPELLAAPGADRLGHPSIEVFRSVIAAHLDQPEMAAEAGAASLELRILASAQNHLADPDLSAARIAHELHVSERHLYKTLAVAGISFAQWVRDQRLAAARADLADPLDRRTTIAAIARRRGFSNPSSFGRAFRETYGMSPGEWRDRDRDDG